MATEEGQVFSCHTVKAWEQQLQKGDDSKKLMGIDFTASWCGSCRFIAPFLAELAKKLPDVIFVKVDVDELKTVAQDWAVEDVHVPERREDRGQGGRSEEGRAAADDCEACGHCFCLNVINSDQSRLYYSKAHMATDLLMCKLVHKA